MTPRFMIAAGSSGSGKTLLTCGLLQALQNRGLQVGSFKCGPDYIDPMFHRKVLGRESYNLDTFFAQDHIINYLLKSHSEDCEISVIEGVMGFYDGVAGTTTKASAYDVARVTDTPVVLIVNGKGMSTSIAAFVKGFVEYREDSHIKGILLNQISGMIYPRLKELIEKEVGIPVYGYVPKLTNCLLESRHLGLVMPDEIENIREKLQELAKTLEKTVDIDGLLELGKSAQAISLADNPMVKIESMIVSQKEKAEIKIAVAKDEAFCFLYADNLSLLEKLGVTISYFSPLRDKELPQDIQGIILSGGYPELYGKELSENTSMKNSIKEALAQGMPCIAECGGFMYLHEQMENTRGESFPMVGSVLGKAYYTGKLSRFGYITMTGGEIFGKQVGEIPAHEFHYFDSTNSGEYFLAKKPMSKRSWSCVIASDTLLAGFPHYYFYGNIELAKAFVQACKKFG